MGAGKFDRRVKIVREMETGRDEYNEPIIDWRVVATVWARQVPQRGSERFAAAQVAGTAVLTFQMRYRSDLTASDRLEFEGRSYEITAPPREIGRRRETEVDTVARSD